MENCMKNTKGTIGIQFNALPNGKLTNIKIIKSTVRNKSVEKCIIDKIKDFIAFLKRNVSFLLLEILMPMAWYKHCRTLLLHFGISLKVYLYSDFQNKCLMFSHLFCKKHIYRFLITTLIIKVGINEVQEIIVFN